MSHKLKPNDLTSLLLKSSSDFSWGTSHNRLVRFDRFVDELKAKFSIVDWETNGDSVGGFSKQQSSKSAIENAKKDLMSLCAGPQLRDIIGSVTCDTFDETVKATRKKLLKDISPLLQLANLLSETQGFSEPFEDYFNRVKTAANSIDWDSFSSENIKNALIATTFASRCHNQYVKGHCLAVRNLDSINLQDILNTALEYEEKNTAPASFPQVGNTGSLFGPPAAGFGGGLFKSAPTGAKTTLFGSSGCDVATSSGLFGQAKPPPPKKCTQNYRYDQDGNLDPSSTNTGSFSGFTFGGGAASRPSGGIFQFGSAPPSSQTGSAQSAAGDLSSGASFEENRTTLFGSPAVTKAAPFGGSKTNIFMSDSKGNTSKEGEASSGQSSSEVEASTATGITRTVKRKRSDAGTADKAS